jgi:hypothetical protein
MHKRPLESILQSGDIFEVTDKSDSDAGKQFLVINQIGTGYKVRDIGTGASHDSYPPFGIYPSDLPAYKKLANIPLDRIKDEFDLFMDDISPGMVLNLATAYEKGLSFTYMDSNQGMVYGTDVQFDKRDVGNAYFHLYAGSGVGVALEEFDIGNLINYNYGLYPTLTKKDVVRLKQDFKEAGLNAPNLKANSAGEPFKQALQLVNPNNAKYPLDFESLAKAYAQLERALNYLGNKHNFKVSF